MIREKLGDLMALPLSYQGGGDMLDARGKTPDADKSDLECDVLAAAVVGALNAHDDMLTVLRMIRRRDVPDAVWDLICSAIAKAEGRT